MLVVGLTGGIGCGKSIVSNLFSDTYHIPIIDADLIAKDLTKKDNIRDLIYKQIGPNFFDQDHNIQRDKLRQAVFSDAEIRDKLENILHPVVFKEIIRELEEIEAEYCLVVVPLLLETKRVDFVDRILVIDCTIEEQIQRVMLRDQCSEAHIKSIIETQLPREDRKKSADDIIENHDSIESLKEKVAILHEKYLKLSRTTLPQ